MTTHKMIEESSQGTADENNSSNMVQQLLDHYDTPRKEIDKSLRAFHSSSIFVRKSEQSRNKVKNEDSDEQAPNSLPSDRWVAASESAVNTTSGSKTPPYPADTSKELMEDPETCPWRSRERYELAKALENFRKYEREKATKSNKSKTVCSKLDRQSSKSDACGDKTGGSHRRITVSRSKYVANDKVLYTSSNGQIQSASILKVYWDQNHNPYYEIRLHISGVDKQTDGAHLSDIPTSEKSKSGNRANKIGRQSSSTSLRSSAEKSYVSQTTRRPRMARRRNSNTLRKVSIERSSLSKGRKTQSVSELSRQRHPKLSSQPPDLSNSTWDLTTSTSSLPKRRARADKFHHSNGTSYFVPSASSKCQAKQPGRGGRARSIQGAHRSWSLESMESQKSTRRKPLRRTKSIDHSGLVASVRHVEPIKGASSPWNAKFPKQGSTQMPSLSRTQSCPVPHNNLAPRGENQAVEINNLPSANRSTTSTQIAPGSHRAAPSSSQLNVDSMDIPSTLKKRPRAFLLWQKAKSVSNLLLGQHM